MVDCTSKQVPRDDAELAANARLALEPLLLRVINALADGGDTGSFFAAGAFVQDLLLRVRKVEEQPELGRLLLDISVIDFQGFELSPSARKAVDALLAECEAITRTLSAGDQLH